MTEEEFERLKRRFGDDISAWPAPHRQEARAFLAATNEAPALGEDAHLDRLILEAARMETDEQALTRKVQERIIHKRRPFFRFIPITPSWQLPAATASFAVILVATGIAGYAIGGLGYARIDDALLALATGDPAAGGIETGLPTVPDESFGTEGFL